jgi:hypothetical protein
MARLKPKVWKIESLEDANLTLKEIGLLEHELEAIDSEAHRQIADIKADAAKQGEGIGSLTCRRPWARIRSTTRPNCFRTGRALILPSAVSATARARQSA